MVKIYFLFPGLVQCEECDYKVSMGDCLKHHKEAKHEECALDADFVFELLHLQFKINLMPLPFNTWDVFQRQVLITSCSFKVT